MSWRGVGCRVRKRAGFTDHQGLGSPQLCGFREKALDNSFWLWGSTQFGSAWCHYSKCRTCVCVFCTFGQGCYKLWCIEATSSLLRVGLHALVSPGLTWESWEDTFLLGGFVAWGFEAQVFAFGAYLQAKGCPWCRGGCLTQIMFGSALPLG